MRCMRNKILVGLLIISTFSQSAYSCREVQWSIAQWVENSKDIYIGRVVGVSIPSLEKQDQFGDQINEIVSLGRVDKVARIKIFNSLKGEPKDFIEAEIKWCGGGQFSIGQQVAIFGDNNIWHIKNYFDSIEAIRKIIAVEKQATSPKTSLISFAKLLDKWQTLIGSITGGVIALFAALIVAYKSERRTDLAAAMHVAGVLVEIRAAGVQLDELAREKPELSDPNNRAYWQAEKLAYARPKISPLFDQYMARITPIDAVAAAHLRLFHTCYLYIEDKLKGVEAAISDQRQEQEQEQRREYIRQNARAIKRSFDRAKNYAEYAEYLISKHILSKWAFWNRLWSRIAPDSKIRKAYEELKNPE